MIGTKLRNYVDLFFKYQIFPLLILTAYWNSLPPFLHLFLFVHACVCMCVCELHVVYVCGVWVINAWVCGYVNSCKPWTLNRAQREMLSVFSTILLLIPLRQCLTLNQKLILSRLVIRNAGIISIFSHDSLFTWRLVIQTQVLTVAEFLPTQLFPQLPDFSFKWG